MRRADGPRASGAGDGRMSVVGAATYRVCLADVAPALESIRSPGGLFVATTNPLPIGGRCVVELVGVRAQDVARVEAVVVSRRLPGGAGTALAPGVTLRAESAATPLRSVATLPAASTLDLVQMLEGLLAKAPVAFELPCAVKAGDVVRLTTGTQKWPGAVAFIARVGSCIAGVSTYRCVVTLGEDQDRSALETFVERMRRALAAQETSTVFRAWKPDGFKKTGTER